MYNMIGGKCIYYFKNPMEKNSYLILNKKINRILLNYFVVSLFMITDYYYKKVIEK